MKWRLTSPGASEFWCVCLRVMSVPLPAAGHWIIEYQVKQNSSFLVLKGPLPPTVLCVASNCVACMSLVIFLWCRTWQLQKWQMTYYVRDAPLNEQKVRTRRNAQMKIQKQSLSRDLETTCHSSWRWAFSSSLSMLSIIDVKWSEILLNDFLSRFGSNFRSRLLTLPFCSLEFQRPPLFFIWARTLQRRPGWQHSSSSFTLVVNKRASSSVILARKVCLGFFSLIPRNGASLFKMYLRIQNGITSTLALAW